MQAETQESAALAFLEMAGFHHEFHLKAGAWLYVSHPTGGNSTHYNVTGPPWQVSEIK